MSDDSPRVILRYVREDVLISCENLDAKLFATYRRCLDGAPWDAGRRANVTVISKIIPILDRLRRVDGLLLLIDKPLADAIEAQTEANDAARAAANDRLGWFDEIASRRGLSLYGYQREGARWLATRAAALLADEMGVGKSAQSLASLPYGAGIVVCPAAVRGSWRAEINKWRPDLKASVIEVFRWPAKNEIVIFNYERLVDDNALTLYTQINPPPADITVIFDEAHYLKNWKAKRSQRARALVDTIHQHDGRAWALTGTPLANRPDELWSLLRLLGLAEELFGSYKAFCEMHHVRAHGAGRVWGLASPEVGERLKRGMLRRLKRDVLADLPEKIYVDRPVDVDMDAVRALDGVLDMLDQRGIDINDFDGTFPDFHDMSRVRAQVAVGKIPALLELVDTAEEEEQPLVVFSAHRAPIEVLCQRKGWGAILGGRDWFVNGKRVLDAQDVVHAFQSSMLKGIALTIGAGSTGITLTRANHLVQVDLDWVPGNNDQATDRIHRIGQTRACQITQLVADHPLERRIAEVIAIKRRHIEASVNAAASAPDADLVGEAIATETIVAAMSRQIAELSGDGLAAHADQPEEAETFEERIVRRAAEEEAERVRRRNAKRLPVARGPETPLEQWSATMLAKLALTNGFKPTHATVCSQLATNLVTGLTSSEWALVTTVLRKYRDQIGDPP